MIRRRPWSLLLLLCAWLFPVLRQQLLVVYLLMPAATRLFAPWLEASVKETL